MSEEHAENESGGFKFAVTLLVALGTVIYSMYAYLQTTPINPLWYWFVCGLIPLMVLLLGGLLLYILFKGYSMEVQDSDQRKSWQNWASRIYLAVFTTFIMSLVLIVYVFALGYLKIERTFAINVGIFAIPILVGVAFNFPLFKQKRPNGSTLVHVFFVVALLLYALFIGLLFWSALYPSVLTLTPLQGHVTVDMESIYYKNDGLIPALIHITGPNTGLSINLSKKESNHNSHLIDSIKYLEPENNPNKITSGEHSVLVGNALDYGKYNVFINTTSLTVGYYELIGVRLGFEKTYGAGGFYLLNSSQQSCTKE